MHWLPGLHLEESQPEPDAPFLLDEHPAARAIAITMARETRNGSRFMVAHAEIAA
jgi:hypothetical protein